jgi:hypothetical protein
MFKDKPLISLKEARKLVDNGNTLTNEELELLVDETTTLIRLIMRMYTRSKSAIIGRGESHD